MMSAAMAAILLSEESAVLGAVGWAYALLVACTLVYLGEHYVIDLIAGLALTLGVDRRHALLERWTDRLLQLAPDGRG